MQQQEQQQAANNDGDNNVDCDGPFPWGLGVFDAHCHPTDTMTSIVHIPRMKTTTLTIMATRGEDQDLVSQVACQLGGSATRGDQSQPQRVIPCFGWHPWFSHQILDDRDKKNNNANEHTAIVAATKVAHYKSVLTISPSEEGKDDQDFFLALPDPKPLSTLITETRARLAAHPLALVGEVGLDRAFRLPSAWLPHEIEARDPSLTPGSREGRRLSAYRVRIGHQKAVLKSQLRLAGELRRAVSIHSVQAHGAVLELLQELWAGHEREMLSRRERKRRRSVAGAHEGWDSEDEEEHGAEGRSASSSTSQRISSASSQSSPPFSPSLNPLPFPPRICMHSYSGPPEPLKQFLHPSVPSDIYFSFSSLINFSTPSGKVIEVIQAVPNDRLLVESDHHCAGPRMDALLEEIVRKVCLLRGWTLEHGVRQLAENWKRFVFG